ncbi:MAG: hypothetical protein U1E63_15260 [Burkholderiales bacterium]
MDSLREYRTRERYSFWPEWSFLPVGILSSLFHSDDDDDTEEHTFDTESSMFVRAAITSIFAAWRITQGISLLSKTA